MGVRRRVEYVDLRQFLSTLRSRWLFSIITFVLGTAATIAFVFTQTPQYGSNVKLFISTPMGGVAEYSSTFIVGQRVASYADLATDATILQNVVDELGLDMTREQLQGKVSANVLTSTQTIQLNVQADSPELAQSIAGETATQVVDLVERLETPSQGSEPPAITARVATEPSVSNVPVSPNIMLGLAVGIMLSLLVAIAGALLRDLLDRTLKSRDDIEKITGVPALATLPFDPLIKKNPVASDTDVSLAEAFRVLRTNLQFASLDESVRSILVSSAVPNEGKTLVATNLALSMVQAGRSVLIIDADMRNPNVAQRLGLENSVGVISVLLGRTTLDDAIQTHVNGVHFLGTGPKPPNPAELLGTQAMRTLLRDARERYDLVIIDAPPMLPVADASILVTEVDGALLLSRYGSTTKEQLRLTIARLQGVGGRLLGTVLNRTPRRSGDTYGYGYGYGYGNVTEETRADRKAARALAKESVAVTDGGGRRASR